MRRSLIHVWCIAGFIVGCSDSSASITESSPQGSSDSTPQPPSLPLATATPLAGVLAFVSTREGGVSHIYLSNADGSDARRLTDLHQAEFTPVWSHDGTKLAFNAADGTYIVNRDGRRLVRLPTGGDWPSWSPDDTQLLVKTTSGLRIVAADGSATGGIPIVIDVPARWFADYDDGPAGANWSPDGTRIAFNAWTSGDLERAFIMNRSGSGVRQFVAPLNGAIWDECGAVWSPDGSRIALLGGMFGGNAFPIGIFAVGIVDPENGHVVTIAVTGTSCWDASYAPTNSFSGVAWSPDQTMLAITKRSPSWNAQPFFDGHKSVSISIVDIATKAERAVIADAYDPAWTHTP
jgi:dipeptidyl aminopeptidase/acylaminoacyl peptidase